MGLGHLEVACGDHLFTIISTLVEAHVKQGLNIYTFVCFIDFKKTFDSISRNYLWEMRNLGVSGKLLKTIQAIYVHKCILRYTIKVNELFTDYFKVDQ